LLFLQKYIEPLLFGRKTRSDKLDELTKTTKAINGELIRVRDEINKQKQVQEANTKMIQTTLHGFKNEMETIKGILLNRKQFASPMSSIVGIPSWQLDAAKKQRQGDDDGAHSNSSENDTEVIPDDSQSKRSPANSDSSLEIM